jgi:glycosyltransferase involved in cell wall biosynthesis
MTPIDHTGEPKDAYILKMFPRFSETFTLSKILELERTGTDVHIFSLKAPYHARRHADVDRVQGPVAYLPQISWGPMRPHLEVLRTHPAGYLKGLALSAKRSLTSPRWSSMKRFLQAGFVGAHLRDRGIVFRCEIIGTGGEESKVRSLIEELELGDIVTLPGPMPREELIDQYPEASVFAAPSVVGKDGSHDSPPTVLIEATPVTGIPELVRDGETGLIVPEDDPADRDRARAMATAGGKLVKEEFDLRTNVARLRHLFIEASVQS